jgi:A/G-specific adenine glycosylase
MQLSSEAFTKIRRRLLAWFDANRRDLPWRRTRDPYAIWFSEIMLQQTLVATVIPYFHRFLVKFPNPARLAAAELQEVLKLWEGLGYYGRARNLHAAARQVVEKHGGRVPKDFASLRALPGIGRYTAGAILSQAFGQKLPVVEANSQRVLCRLFGQGGDVRSSAVRDWLWETAAGLLPDRRVGDFNQALMELGALVCTQDSPRCNRCPLSASCEAHKTGHPERFPLRKPLKRTIEIAESAVVLKRGQRVLLLQRPPDGRWAEMWEFPHGPIRTGETTEDAAVRLALDFTGLSAELEAELATLRHSVTHHRIRLVCLEALAAKGKIRLNFYQQARWLIPSDLANFPVSSPQRRLAKLLVSPAHQRRWF